MGGVEARRRLPNSTNPAGCTENRRAAHHRKAASVQHSRLLVHSNACDDLVHSDEGRRHLIIT